MFPRHLLATLSLFLPLFTLTPVSRAQARPIEPNGPAHPANSFSEYAALRSTLPTGEGIHVENLTLERQGGRFHFDEGAFYFYAPVNGMVTGAVFNGKGSFQLEPKDVSEARSLARLTKSGVMQQTFSTVVLRFTDGTADELRKAPTGSAGMTSGSITQAAVERARDFRRELRDNVEPRLLPDVLARHSGGFFLATFRMGGAFSRNVLFEVDPNGTLHAAPDQVELTSWSSDELDVWTAYRIAGSRQPAATQIHIGAQDLDVAFSGSGDLKGSAQTTLTVNEDGLRVLPLALYPTLRVSGVYAESGAPLDFVQEAKDVDAQFAIVLPQPAKRGDTIRLLTRYAGPGAVRRDGQDIFYLMPGARESWYPSLGNEFGDFSTFHMTFHLPRRLQIIATGKQLSLTPEPGGTRAVWATDSPIPVAGFNLGDFKSSAAATPRGFQVTAFANTSLPDYASQLPEQGEALGSMSTIPALKSEVSQGTAAIEIYSEFFGKLPYDHVALTQQSACNYGQSWPMLVYLPTCAFWDATVQHQLGLLDQDRGYWTQVTAHEVSHQWWGNLIGFSSYRDQWMSEGFATFSVGLYLLNTSNKMNDYRDFWTQQKNNILRKNAQGIRPIDVGRLTMGVRTANQKTGNVYQDLIYSKGAFVMHMRR